MNILKHLKNKQTIKLVKTLSEFVSCLYISFSSQEVLQHVVTVNTCETSKHKLLFWFNKWQRFGALMLFPCSCALINSQLIGSHLDSTRCGQSQHTKLCRVSRKKTSQLTTTCTGEILQRVYGFALWLPSEVREGTLTCSFGMKPVWCGSREHNRCKSIRLAS